MTNKFSKIKPTTPYSIQIRLCALGKYNSCFLLLPCLILSNGCAAQCYKQSIDLPFRSAENLYPSAPPLTPSSSPAHYASSTSIACNTITTTDSKTLTKKEAKEKARNYLIQAKKNIKKCYGYEKQIRQITRQENKWQRFSQGSFISQWIGNYFIENKRRSKAGKIGLFKAILNEATQNLDEMEQYFIQAKNLNSKKESKRLHKQSIELKGQIEDLCHAMNALSFSTT